MQDRNNISVFLYISSDDSINIIIPSNDKKKEYVHMYDLPKWKIFWLKISGGPPPPESVMEGEGTPAPPLATTFVPFPCNEGVITSFSLSTSFFPLCSCVEHDNIHDQKPRLRTFIYISLSRSLVPATVTI